MTTAGGKPLSAVKGLFPRLAPRELKKLSEVLFSIGGDNSLFLANTISELSTKKENETGLLKI